MDESSAGAATLGVGAGARRGGGGGGVQSGGVVRFGPLTRPPFLAESARRRGVRGLVTRPARAARRSGSGGSGGGDVTADMATSDAPVGLWCQKAVGGRGMTALGGGAPARGTSVAELDMGGSGGGGSGVGGHAAMVMPMGGKTAGMCPPAPPSAIGHVQSTHAAAIGGPPVGLLVGLREGGDGSGGCGGEVGGGDVVIGDGVVVGAVARNVVGVLPTRPVGSVASSLASTGTGALAT